MRCTSTGPARSRSGTTFVRLSAGRLTRLGRVAKRDTVPGISTFYRKEYIGANERREPCQISLRFGVHSQLGNNECGNSAVSPLDTTPLDTTPLEGAWPRSVHCLDDHKKETQARPLKRENDLIYSGKSRHASIGSCRDQTIRGPGPRTLPVSIE